MAGVIYKITNPSDKIYIGCTIDFKRRLSEYRRLSINGQVKIYNSLSKYGFDKHVFEIIEECDDDALHEREIYWIKYFNCIEEGLNIRLGNRTGSLTEDTKQKISAALKGRKNTWIKPGEGWAKGYKYTEEQKQKLSNGLKEYYKHNAHKPKPKSVSPAIVEEIRNKFQSGTKRSDLSREYNVSWGTIKNITDYINSYQK
jgi:group I intron endonuclease